MTRTLWRNVVMKIVLNINIRSLLILIEIWSAAIKLSGPRAFRLVVTTMVAVVVAPFFVAIIIATWSGGRGGRSSTEPLGTWSRWVEPLETWSTWSRWLRWMNAARTDMVRAIRDPPCTLQLACTTSCNSTAGPSDGECVHVVDLVCACMAIRHRMLGS